MAGPDSYPSMGSFFKEHPSSIRPPFESGKSEARERLYCPEPMGDLRTVFWVYVLVCVCKIRHHDWYTPASYLQDPRAWKRDIHRLLLTHKYNSVPTHTSVRLMKVWFTIYTYLWCEVWVIVYKILFKVTISISLVSAVFLPIGHGGIWKVASQNISETSPPLTHSLTQHQ